MAPTFANSIRIRLERLSAAEFVSVAIISALVALTAGVWVAYRIGYFDGQVKCGYPCVGSGHKDTFVDAIRMRIAIAFAATAIGIAAKKPFSFFVALLALAFIEMQYVSWYFWSIRWLREVALEDFSTLPSQTDIPHALGLYAGTGWDILLLGTASALLLWQLRLLLGAFQVRRKLKK